MDLRLTNDQVDRAAALDAAAPTEERSAPHHRVANQDVIVGNCLDVMAQLPAKSVDIVVTSPPYNIGIAYRAYEDTKPKPDYLTWIKCVASAIARVLRDDGALFLNVGSTGADPWVATDVAAQFRELFVLQNQIIWVKSISIGDDTVGHFKPITSRRFLNNSHESIFHFTRLGTAPIDRLAIGVPFKDKSNIGRWGHARDRRCAGNTWFIPYETVRSKKQKYHHPAGFPVELPTRCIKLHGKPGPVVLDPFLGAGTTLVAAKELGARGIGIEIDPFYARSAIERLSK